MNTPVVALIAATLLSGSASAYLWQELRTERTATQQLQSRIVELERAAATPAPAPSLPAAQPEPTPSSPQSSDSARAPAPPPASARQPVAVAGMNGVSGRLNADPDMRRRMQASIEQQQRMLDDPDYRELMREQNKLSMSRFYSDLGPMLGLTQDESERLLDVLAEQQLRNMEQRPVMMGMDGTPPDPNTLREQQLRFEEMRRKKDAELAQVLGAAKFAEWQDYQNNQWSRSQVMRLREGLALSDEPLRQDQVKPLVQAMAREQQQMQTHSFGGVPRMRQMDSASQAHLSEEWLERTTQSHQRIRDAVSGLLSPAQLQQLEAQQAQERKMQEINMRMQRARAAEAQVSGEINMMESSSGFFAPGAIR